MLFVLHIAYACDKINNKKKRGERVNGIIRGYLSAVELSLSDTELSARLGGKVSFNDEKMQAVCSDIFAVLDIKFVASRLSLTRNEKGVAFDSFSIDSTALTRYFEGSSETYLFVATLGIGVDRLVMKKRALSVSEGFLYDAVCSAVAEAACDAVEKKICGSERTKNRFSPGYADCPLEVQRGIFNLISPDKYIGVKLLDSLLMSPMKSVSAFVAILP